MAPQSGQLRDNSARMLLAASIGTPNILPSTQVSPKWGYDGMEALMPTAAFTTAQRTRPLILLAVLAAAIIAGTLGLWAFYGTSVFFEMVRSGWLACF